ncbi:response regulator transcription factor [Dermatophilaceae bacterium Sec6.4]
MGEMSGAEPKNQPHQPITVALVDDYDVVLLGVKQIIDQYSDRVVVTEIDTNRPVQKDVDIVLYDAFAQPEADKDAIGVLLASSHASRVVIYTWNFQAELIEQASALGVHGYLSKSLPARDFITSLEAVHAGEVIVNGTPTRGRTITGLDWPGRGEGLSDRESEVLALITQGFSNAEVARRTFLSPNTVKSYIRTIYRKIDVSSRTQAVLWGIDHGFSPDHHRIDGWRV